MKVAIWIVYFIILGPGVVRHIVSHAAVFTFRYILPSASRGQAPLLDTGTALDTGLQEEGSHSCLVDFRSN